MNLDRNHATLEQSHDLSGFAEMSVAEHFGGSGDMDVYFVEIFGLFASA